MDDGKENRRKWLVRTTRTEYIDFEVYAMTKEEAGERFLFYGEEVASSTGMFEVDGVELISW